MRLIVLMLTVSTLAACQPAHLVDPVPTGVGFEDYASYQAQREVALRQNTPAPIQSGPFATGPAGQAGQPQGQPLSAVQAAPRASAGISDEQNFEAVAARETIESDRQRLAANRQQYQQIQPGALPERSGPERPNIVAYALSAPNRLGETVYNRSNPLRFNAFERNCARFASQDLAQEEFLRRGGPNRDPRNLDPDGDGFACRWDPTPFQKVRG